MLILALVVGVLALVVLGLALVVSARLIATLIVGGLAFDFRLDVASGASDVGSVTIAGQNEGISR